MRGLRKEAIHCLMLEFPSTLKEWTDQDFNYVIDDNDSLEGMFEILYLAYEHSIISILPALYLRICLSFNSVSLGSTIFAATYLNSCITVSKKSSSTFMLLQKKRPSITDC